MDEIWTQTFCLCVLSGLKTSIHKLLKTVLKFLVFIYSISIVLWAQEKEFKTMRGEKKHRHTKQSLVFWSSRGRSAGGKKDGGSENDSQEEQMKQGRGGRSRRRERETFPKNNNSNILTTQIDFEAIHHTEVKTPSSKLSATKRELIKFHRTPLTWPTHKPMKSVCPLSSRCNVNLHRLLRREQVVPP